MKGYLSTLLVLMFVVTGFSQSNFWRPVSETTISTTKQQRLIVPSRYETLRLELSDMKAMLANAPSETGHVAGIEGLLVDFPTPDGGFSTFEVWEAPVMDPSLTARYPEIRSFAGKNRAGDYIRFDVSPLGFHAMVLSVERQKTYYVDPYSTADMSHYVCYFRSDYPKPVGKDFECLVNEMFSDVNEITTVSDRAGSCGNLKTYRLALACTGEYANFHGSTGTNIAPALAAMNTSMTRVNGVFEIDAGLRMILVENTDQLIYTNASTDPYTNNNGSSMLSQNITTCNNVIGSANYDIGHVFSTGGGGVAYLGCVCGSSKAGGVTGSPSPIGDPFDIDYVAHEMGHQFGAEHTQYNNCQRSNASAMEPGSASTIMGYAGICAPNVQNNSDPYFHARSIGQMAAFINTGAGNNCDVLVPNGNSAPTCDALVNRTIPKSTPFVLTANGADADGDAINYCWEQMNAFQNPAQTMPPTSTNKSGPVFRSFNPSTSSSRYFPMFSDVLNNTSGTWEKLPSINRTMNFRVTVRDNHANGGCTTERDMVVTVTANAGPFVITQPNTNVSWAGGSSQTVTWNVAGTTGNGVNTANVEILISTDGGANFSTLLASTPNDGSQAVTIPNVSTTQARIMVRAVGNIFYDVSDANFTITFSFKPNGGEARNIHVVESIAIFPNPSAGLIQVHAPKSWVDEVINLRIYDMHGKIVLEDHNFLSGQTVDVINLRSGLYQVEAIQGNQQLRQLLVKQ